MHCKGIKHTLSWDLKVVVDAGSMPVQTHCTTSQLASDLHMLLQVQPGSCICLMRGEYERMLQQEESAVLPDLRLAAPFRGVPVAEHALPNAYGAPPKLLCGPHPTLPQWLAAPSPSGVLPGLEPLKLQEAAAASQTASCKAPEALPGIDTQDLLIVQARSVSCCHQAYKAWFSITRTGHSVLVVLMVESPVMVRPSAPACHLSHVPPSHPRLLTNRPVLTRAIVRAFICPSHICALLILHSSKEDACQVAKEAVCVFAALKRPRLCSVKVVSEAVPGEDPPSAQQALTESAAASLQDLRHPVLRRSASAQGQSSIGSAASAFSPLLLPCPAKSSSESADRKMEKRRHLLSKIND